MWMGLIMCRTPNLKRPLVDERSKRDSSTWLSPHLAAAELPTFCAPAKVADVAAPYTKEIS